MNLFALRLKKLLLLFRCIRFAFPISIAYAMQTFHFRRIRLCRFGFVFHFIVVLLAFASLDLLFPAAVLATKRLKSLLVSSALQCSRIGDPLQASGSGSLLSEPSSCRRSLNTLFEFLVASVGSCLSCSKRDLSALGENFPQRPNLTLGCLPKRPASVEAEPLSPSLRLLQPPFFLSCIKPFDESIYEKINAGCVAI